MFVGVGWSTYEQECVFSNIKPSSLGLLSIQAGKGGATPANQRLWKKYSYTTLQVVTDISLYIADFFLLCEVVVTLLVVRKFF